MHAAQIDNIRTRFSFILARKYYRRRRCSFFFFLDCPIFPARLPLSSLVRLLFPLANSFFLRSLFPGGKASECRPHPRKRSHHPLPGYCPVTNHFARLRFFVQQKPVESTGQERTTFVPPVHQRNSIESTSLPAGTVQTGRAFRVLTSAWRPIQPNVSSPRPSVSAPSPTKNSRPSWRIAESGAGRRPSFAVPSWWTLF